MDTTITREPLMTPLFHLELVKDRDISYTPSIIKTEEAAEVLHKLLDSSPTEQQVVLYQDSHGILTGAEKVGMGTVASVSTRPTELFRGAIVHGSPRILVCHNHPSVGVPKPSQEDVTFTVAAIELASQLGILVVDHIVLSRDGHYSIREHQTDLAQEFMEAQMQLGMGGASIPPGILEAIKEKLMGSLRGTHGKPSIIEETEFPPSKGDKDKSNDILDWQDTLSFDYLRQ